MNTRNMFKITASLMLSVFAAVAFVACEDEPDKYEVASGSPEVIYITTPANSDSLITEAFMGKLVVLIGNNLRSITKLYFNDVEAVLNSSLITDHTLICTVPNDLPSHSSNIIYMVNSCGDTTKYDFVVRIPAPVLNSMTCEMLKPGEIATINGDYLLDYEDSPLTIVMPDGTTITEFKSCTKTAVSFVVPDGCTKPGQIVVTSKYGATKSTRFNFNDNRGLITDFDGTTDIVPQGWNVPKYQSEDEGITGKYAILGPEDLDENASWNENYKLPFWCGTWNGNPMGITSGVGVPICNVIDFTDWKNMAFKFELCVPKSNPWMAGALQVVFASAADCANDTWQNNTYIQTSAVKGGKDLSRGIYRPWEATGSFDTNDEWITVTIPFSEFVYNYDGSKVTAQTLEPDAFASLILWVNGGGVAGTACAPILKLDNLRAVPYK
ncbi:MAG: IPT/TIG domain-containing protein [Marinilabiliaceae bacterium]|nr:IPT/TIG domain-containing protein [Marinilabiliaceae bacterium]